VANRRATRTAAQRKVAAKRKTARKAAAKRTVATKKRTVGEKGPVGKGATLVRGTAKGILSAIAARLPWGGKENDPIRLLETDHRRFEELLKQGEESTERAAKTRPKLLTVLTEELHVHELLEEKVLYPALAPHPETRDLVLEGYEEHHVADLIVKELHGVAADDEQWGAKFKVLKENIEHHIEEEEREMFRAARGVLSREELDAIGTRMKALRKEQRPR
jgi:hemerythrin-like domain-containing protein